MVSGNNSPSLQTLVTLNYEVKNHLQPVSLNLVFVAAERWGADGRFWECAPSSISCAHSRLAHRPITRAVNNRHCNVWTRLNCQAFAIIDVVTNSVWTFDGLSYPQHVGENSGNNCKLRTFLEAKIQTLRLDKRICFVAVSISNRSAIFA
jgi:hypothetical protein